MNNFFKFLYYALFIVPFILGPIIGIYVEDDLVRAILVLTGSAAIGFSFREVKKRIYK